jgi:hypothetical protein
MVNFLEFLSPFFVQSRFTAQLLQSVRENFVDMVTRPVALVFSHHPVLSFSCGQIGKLAFPIDLECGEVVAFRLPRVMAVLLDRTDDFDVMLLAAFENQLGSNIRAVHRLAGGE